MNSKKKQKTNNTIGWLLTIFVGAAAIFFGGKEATPSTSTSEPAENSYFEVHFIDVGQADAALVLCDDKYMLVDGGNSADSALIYTYLKNLEITYLDYIVASHAHEDHVGGLAGALNYADVGAVYCPVTSYDSEPFRDFFKYVEAKNVEITVPEAGDTFSLGSATVEVLGLNAGSEENDTSIIMKISYGETSFLFTGDAEREAEQAVLDSGCDLSSTVLKVGHHGGNDSSTYPFLREVMPGYAIISVGGDNSYGHPTEGALSRLEDAGAQIYRTDIHGNIIVTSDGQSVTVSTEKNTEKTAGNSGSSQASEEQGEEEVLVSVESAKENTQGMDEPVEEENQGTSGLIQSENKETDEPTDGVIRGTKYILNSNSKKFHIPSCSSVETIAEHNYAEYTGTAEEVEAMGYVGCKRCNP